MKPLHIHYFQHVPFEDLGCMEDWVSENGHQLSATKFFQADPLPQLNGIDWLIVMGGPMSVHDTEKFPWLVTEKQFIRQAIAANKTVIGICLGSQLVAEALGASVYPGKEKEIGWFPVYRSQEGKNHEIFAGFPATLPVFHWHGDTFDLPEDAENLAYSDAFAQQAFLYNNKVLGLQFHLEVTPKTLQQMLVHCREELVPGKYIQSEAQILQTRNHFEENNQRMFALLDQLSEVEWMKFNLRS